ncbi:uncharacterized protein LOC134538938 [Bacillus rossius redtenbacheri]|uniref:uncharacterized protein LOC134538938 n=1 Tax=Bacillus rossius redtenbacheri TaxID=93214 RepID=UPI002FDE00D4
MDEFIGYVLGLPVVQVTMYKVQGTFLHRWDQQPLHPAECYQCAPLASRRAHELLDCFQTMTSSSSASAGAAASFQPVGWVLDPAEAEHDRQQTYVLWRTDDIVEVSAADRMEQAAASPRHKPSGRRCAAPSTKGRETYSKILQRQPRRPGPKARRHTKVFCSKSLDLRGGEALTESDSGEDSRPLDAAGPTAEDFVEHEACSALARALQDLTLCKPYSPSLRDPGSAPRAAVPGSLGPVSRVLAWMLDAETTPH